MSGGNENSLVIKITRWTARVWSLFVFAITLLIIFTPDPHQTEEVPLSDWFMLSLWGIAVLGLVIAWRWEFIGGIITISIMIFREVIWIFLKGDWLVNFLIVWAVVVPPAVLFIVAGFLEQRNKEA